MTRNIKLTIEYDGAAYHGWQIQDPSLEGKSIQGEIKAALQKILKENILLHGSGRTDSGVHALGQAASFKTRSDWPLLKIQKALNGVLPEDISIVDVQEVPVDFHAQYSAKSKLYRYSILNREAKPAVRRGSCLFFRPKLNLALMKREGRRLVGRHDFKSFQATPSREIREKNKNTIRTITRLDIKKKGDLISIEIEADGFLHKMVRNIVGTLLEIGRGRFPEGSMAKMLAQKNRLAAGPSAKACGLTLVEVRYER